MVKQGAPELAFKFSLAPSFPYCHLQIKLSLFLTLTLPENNQIMSSGQLSHQW